MNMMSTDPRIDLTRTALLIIDVQRALFARPTPIYEADKLIKNINSLVGVWQNSGGLIIYVQHSNKKMLVKNTVDWELHPDLPVRDSDTVIEKVHGNAFQDTGLGEMLDSKGIREIVVTGLVTNGCVRATCIGGKKLGYRVILVRDGHSNYNKDAPKIIEEWNQRLAKDGVELLSSEEVVCHAMRVA
jgi:nicotinamidase-related amidase